jgi:hypothetical protein
LKSAARVAGVVGRTAGLGGADGTEANPSVRFWRRFWSAFSRVGPSETSPVKGLNAEPVGSMASKRSGVSAWNRTMAMRRPRQAKKFDARCGGSNSAAPFHEFFAAARNASVAQLLSNL